jgi:hypothetical protein
MQGKCNVNVRLKIVADTKDCTMVHTVTMLQKNWLIGSAKRKHGNGPMRDVLVYNEIKQFTAD